MLVKVHLTCVNMENSYRILVFPMLRKMGKLPLDQKIQAMLLLHIIIMYVICNYNLTSLNKTFNRLNIL